MGKLKKIYSNFDEFNRYCEVYGIHTRIGYNSPEEAWKANPTIEGGINPSSLKRVNSK